MWGFVQEGPDSGPGGEFTSAITTASRLVLSDPWLLAVFLVPSMAILVVESLILSYYGQAAALLSQAVPGLLGPPKVVAPRSIIAVPGVVTVAILTLLGFGLAAGVVAVRIDAVLRGTPISLTGAIRRAGARSMHVFAYILVAGIVVAAGTVALVLPGIVAATRLFLGVPAIALDGASVATAARRSWDRTAGRQLPIAGLVVIFGVTWFVLAGLPLLGVPIATAMVGTVGMAAATVLYRRIDRNPSIPSGR